MSLRRIAEPLPDELVAIMCASHNGEPVHVRAVRRLLRAGGLSERDLGCPPDLPIEAGARRAAAGPRRITHNCSGKHAGMLLACERSGADLGRYLEPSHPLQREILRAVRSATGVDRPVVGSTGAAPPSTGSRCAAWPPCSPRLAGPERLGRLGARAARAVEAMRSAPYLVAGRGRSDTRLMEAGARPRLQGRGGGPALRGRPRRRDRGRRADRGRERPRRRAGVGEDARPARGAGPGAARCPRVPRGPARARRRPARGCVRGRVPAASRPAERSRSAAFGATSRTIPGWATCSVTTERNAGERSAPRDEPGMSRGSPWSACTRPRSTSRVRATPAG